MPRQTAPLPTRFIVVKTRPEWRGFPMPERLRPPCEDIASIRATRGECVSRHFYDTALYSACVTDGCIEDAQDHHACARAIEALRKMPFRNRCVDIVEILPVVENVCAAKDDEIALSAARVHAGYRRDSSVESAQSFFRYRLQKETTVATCGTTVVVRDSTVTLWA
ncbi:darcynin family protein [Burkholderia lata]|uniref:darcynin family protein n=1 Tax=Burkholderia lata (strain ATCC 17760 / DSM 23089 / LMG 22485 / NCIMB 9086 / R18194 / 383) TaxID=482957 RepID=UPI0015825BCC|nr:darcynin family protein [Burkholderia lata]